jgi:hypothetical protein
MQNAVTPLDAELRLPTLSSGIPLASSIPLTYPADNRISMERPVVGAAPTLKLGAIGK